MLRPNELLSEALFNAGFRADGSLTEAAAESLLQQYASEQIDLLRQQPGFDWNAIVRSVAPARSDNDLLRVAAFGALMTRFTTSFLTNASNRSPVLQAGTLCNLLVALYDHYADRGDGFFFPREAVYTALVKKEPHESDSYRMQTLAANGTEQQRVIAQLIGVYLQLLHETGGATQTIEKAILKMLDAENETTTHAVVPHYILLRKSALPFVVMGLPALRRDTASFTLFTYLSWLYRLGDFIGWADDFADLENDRVKQHANRLSEENEGELYERAQRVAATGRNLLLQREIFQQRQAFDDSDKQLFILFTMEWLK